MNKYLRLMEKNAMRAVLRPLRLRDINKRQVLIINDLGYNFSGNPKVVAEYLHDKCPELSIIYSVKNPSKYEFLQKKGYKIVKFNSFDYMVAALTSKVIVTNSGGMSYIPLNMKKQTVINTWHGGGAYKTAGIDMYGDSYTFRKDLKLAAKQTTYFLSTNKRFTECVSHGMMTDKSKFWEIGMPRNDDLINGNKLRREKIRSKVGIKPEEHLILFCPTYRKIDDNYFNDSIAISYGIDPDRVCEAFQKRFGGVWKFAIRLHPCIVNRSELDTSKMLDLTDYEDMQDLLLASDAMINDFSSSIWDFMLTRKPGFIFAVDLDEYIRTTRVYTPIEDWPFPIAKNNDELVSNILNFDYGEFNKKCDDHYRLLGGVETGKATELVCNKIMSICEVKD